VLDAGGPAAGALTALGRSPDIAESLPAAESAKIQARRKPARNEVPRQSYPARRRGHIRNRRPCRCLLLIGGVGLAAQK
jgi:hypothetical protein